jgi:anti-sigma regulatory factor (Ser/Thr protein kinase)
VPTLLPLQQAGMPVTAYPWPLCSCLELGALPTAVPCARLHARQVAWEWGLNGITETIELLVSELTTNAVQAAAGYGSQSPICLRLLADDVRVRIEVWDADPRPPTPKDFEPEGLPDLEAEGGRGLFLVAVLSTRWNWRSTREPVGKVVWCELDVGGPESCGVNESAAQSLLPRRTPSAVHVRPVTVMHDPDVLCRLRDALRNLDCS